MARYFDADAFFETFGELNTEPYINFPTADVVDVARCRDCDYFKDENTCEATMSQVTGNDYCSFWKSTSRLDAGYIPRTKSPGVT